MTRPEIRAADGGIVYGVACERTPQRTAALTALVLAVHAHAAMMAVDADGSGWDMALTGYRRATSAAVDACILAASEVLPRGAVGGELLTQARAGSVRGLDVSLERLIRAELDR